MIPFNKPPLLGSEKEYVLDAMQQEKISGDGNYTKKCQKWFEDHTQTKLALLTPSCTHALEMAALLLDLKEGDEVIMPSYTFVSTANAFALRGAKVVFVDIRPDTMNIDEMKIEAALSQKTKAIVVVHYAGVACEMGAIMTLAEKHKLFVVEDAAQAMMSTYKSKTLGTIGDLGTYSFHETKNYTSGGEGGVLLVNNEKFKERAEIIREKGTNRKQFFRGLVDKYSWVDLGSSYLPSELQVAYLYAQLKRAEQINQTRLDLWSNYYEKLKPLQEQKKLELPTIPKECTHNAHMFYIKVKDLKERTKFLEHLHNHEVMAVFHYVPLHSSEAGERYTRFAGEDRYTTKESERLIRLPMYYGLTKHDQEKVVQSLFEFYKKEKEL